MDTSNKKKEGFRYWIPILVITPFFISIYLLLAYKLNIWLDESFTLSTISVDSLKELIRTSILFEGQPPFYFIVAFIWSQINDSVFFIRILSILFTIVSGLLLYNLYKRNSVNSHWWVIILIFANPFMLYLATEIRCYALVVFFSLLLIHLFQKYYSNQKVPIFIRIIFVITSIAAVNTQYFVAFLLLSNGIYLLVKGFKKTFITYFIDMVFVLISIAWVLFFISKQISILPSLPNNFEGVDILRFIFGRYNDYIFNRHQFPYRFFGYVVQILIILAIILNLYFRRQIQHFIKRNLYLFVLVIVLSFCFLFAYIKLGDEFLSIRHTAVLFSSIFILFLMTFDYFQNLYFKGLLLFTVFSFYVISDFNSYKDFVKDFDVKSTVNYLSNNSLSNESILINRNQLALPFIYYFEKENKINVFPYLITHSTGFTYSTSSEPHTVEEVQGFIQSMKKSKSIWVLNYVKRNSANANFNTLMKLLQFNYSLKFDTIIGDSKRKKSFDDVQIRKYEMFNESKGTQFNDNKSY